MNMMFGVNCEKVAQWMSESLDQELPWYKRMVLRVHFLTCVMCKESAKQIQILHQIYQNLTHPSEEDASIRLSPSAKHRINEVLKQKI